MQANTIHNLDALSLYLSRSKTIPVDITIIERLVDSRHLLDQLGVLLARHIHHCQKLTINLQWGAFITMSYLEGVSAPLLQFFDVSYTEESSLSRTSDQLEPATMFRGGAPRLSTIYLRGDLYNIPLLRSATTLYIHNFQSRSIDIMEH